MVVVMVVECLSPWQGFGGEDDVVLCGVFDGHGPHGHLVARRVRDALPLKLMSAVRASKAGFDMPAAAWRKAFASAYKAMDKDLRSHAILDCFCSGSTAVTVLKLVRATGLDASLLSIDSSFLAETYVKSFLLGCMRGSALHSPLTSDFCTQGSDLCMANIGDSRAVLGSRNSGGGGGMVAVQLTVDLKPDVPSRPPYSPSTIISDLWMSCRVIRNLSVNATFCHFRRGRTDQEVQGQGICSAGRTGGAASLAAVR
jgi:serine/threonine protein phosphatase PrpC